MEKKEDEEVKNTRVVEARARNISRKVRCSECGSQSIEDSQADIAILLRKLIRDEIHSGKSDKEIFKKLEDDFGETVLYAPKFDLQTAAFWLSPILCAGAAGGIWAYSKHRQKSNVHVMALNLIRGVPLTPKEKETILDILTPPPPAGATPLSWWRSFLEWTGTPPRSFPFVLTRQITTLRNKHPIAAPQNPAMTIIAMFVPLNPLPLQVPRGLLHNLTFPRKPSSGKPAKPAGITPDRSFPETLTCFNR